MPGRCGTPPTTIGEKIKARIAPLEERLKQNSNKLVEAAIQRRSRQALAPQEAVERALRDGLNGY